MKVSLDYKNTYKLLKNSDELLEEGCVHVVLFDNLGQIKKSKIITDFQKSVVKDRLSDQRRSLKLIALNNSSLICVLIDKNLDAYQKQEFFRKQLLPRIDTTVEKSLNVEILFKKEAQKNLDYICSTFFIAHWPKFKYSPKSLDQVKGAQLNVSVNNVLTSANIKTVVNEAWVLTYSQWIVKTLAEAPGNLLTPKEFLALVKDVSKKNNLKVDFWDIKKLKTKKAGAFLAVNQADPDTSAGIVKITYTGKKSAKKHSALVGKGVCFDTGGYNLKPGSSMYGMNQDMTGAALAFANIVCAAQMKSKQNLVAYLALAENHVSPTAFKENDVIESASGKTIEIVHTDAEGRMVLADTLFFAAEARPETIFSFATLTGTCVKSLGKKRSGIFSNSEKLHSRLYKSALNSGERIWCFPMGAEYSEGLKSKWADLKQCRLDGSADHIYAATFLNEFVAAVNDDQKNKSSYIHMDLSAHESPGGLGLVPSDTNSYGVRLMAEYLELS